MIFQVLLLPILTGSAQAQVATRLAPTLDGQLVVNADRKEAYVCTPDLNVQAISTVDGSALWVSPSKAKPLAMWQGRLLCLAETPGNPRELRIQALNVAQSGRQVSQFSLNLDERAKMMLQPGLGQSLAVMVKEEGNDLVIQYDYQYREIQGMDDGSNGKNDVSVSGRAKLDQAFSKLSLMAGETGPMNGKSVYPQEADLVRSEKGVQQYLAQDGKCILASVLDAPDSLLNTYRWTIYEKGTQKKLGECRRHLAFSKFVVLDNLLLTVTGPYEYLKDGKVVRVPYSLEAIDLLTGRTKWIRQVLSPYYDGPTPP